MNSTTLKQINFLVALGLICLALQAVEAQDAPSTTEASTVIEPPAAVPAAADAAAATEEEEESEETPEIEIEVIEEEGDGPEDGSDEFMISLEDSLAQFVIRHRDVRRDCNDLAIDLELQQQSGEKADTDLQQEYMACVKYRQELEQNIIELASHIEQAGPPAAPPSGSPPPPPPASSPPSSESSGGFLSSITDRLPSLG